MITKWLALSLLTLSTSSFASDPCAPDAAEAAGWERAERLAGALPNIFRYDVVWDDRIDAIVAEPKCVVNYLENHHAWNTFVVRNDIAHLIFSWTLDIAYPGVTSLTSTTFATHRVTLGYRAFFRTWVGDIHRDEDTTHPLALPFEVPDCSLLTPSRSSVYRRGKNGTLFSKAYRLKVLERNRRACLAGARAGV